MSQTILLKRSAIQGNIPTTANLALGELGMNTFDGKIFLRKDNGAPSILDLTDANNHSFTPSGNITSATVQAAIQELDSEKQAALVSGTNIRTINGNTLLGSTDLAISGNVTVTDDTSTNITYYPVLGTSATGSLNAKASSTKLTYNPSTGALAATSMNVTTPTAGDNSTKVATTAFVTTANNLKANNSDLLMAIGNINSPLLDMPLRNSTAMRLGVGSVTFARASTATYIDKYGVLQNSATDTARFEKDGYLNEGSSTNMLIYSAGFDNAAWLKENSTASANTTTTVDPYGTNTAEAIFETTTNGTHALYTSSSSISFTAGVTYTQSWFIKPNGRNVFRITTWVTQSFTIEKAILVNFLTGTISVFNGVVSSYKLEALANGWFRVQLSYAADVTGAGFGAMIRPRLDDGVTESYVGDVTKGFFVFGAQLEALPFASSYIPTTTATVTRAQDKLKITGVGNIGLGYNAKSIVVDAQALGVSTTIDSRIIDVENFSYNMFRYSHDGTSIQVYYSAGTVSATINFKLKHRFIYTVGLDNITTNNISFYVDGVLVSTQPGVAFASNAGAPPFIHIGESTSGSEPCFAHITGLRIYDRTLTAYEVTLV